MRYVVYRDLILWLYYRNLRVDMTLELPLPLLAISTLVGLAFTGIPTTLLGSKTLLANMRAHTPLLDDVLKLRQLLGQVSS